MSGHLEVICGPMYAGKSEELIRRLRRFEIAGEKFTVIGPDIDNRYADGKIVSHVGNSFDCIALPTKGKAIEIPTNILAIDEAQFFESQWLIWSISDAIDYGMTVIASGLDLDFKRRPFGAMPQLLSMAKYVVKLRSVCNMCGAQDAMYTQRLIDGKPAPLDGATILVGGTENYEARCEECWGK